MVSPGFVVREVSQSDARAFASYVYPAPYDVYDTPADSTERFLDAANAYVSVVSLDGTLWGFACTGIEAQVPGGSYDSSGIVIDVGVGMAPDRVGRGTGRAFCQAAVDYARGAADVALQVTVADFNHRSLHVWQALGFSETRRFDHRFSGRPFRQLVCQDGRRLDE